MRRRSSSSEACRHAAAAGCAGAGGGAAAARRTRLRGFGPIVGVSRPRRRLPSVGPQGVGPGSEPSRIAAAVSDTAGSPRSLWNSRRQVWARIGVIVAVVSPRWRLAQRVECSADSVGDPFEVAAAAPRRVDHQAPDVVDCGGPSVVGRALSCPPPPGLRFGAHVVQVPGPAPLAGPGTAGDALPLPQVNRGGRCTTGAHHQCPAVAGWG